MNYEVWRYIHTEYRIVYRIIHIPSTTHITLFLHFHPGLKNLGFWKSFFNFVFSKIFRFKCTKTGHKIVTQKFTKNISWTLPPATLANTDKSVLGLFSWLSCDLIIKQLLSTSLRKSAVHFINTIQAAWVSLSLLCVFEGRSHVWFVLLKRINIRKFNIHVCHGCLRDTMLRDKRQT